MTVSDSRKVEYLPLADLQENPKNPKTHELQTVGESISRFGMIDPIVVDGRTGFLIAGHGRKNSLEALRNNGETPPEGVQVTAEGDWLVPVLTGWGSRSDSEANAALIALNRTTEIGGWDDEALAGLLDELAEVDGGLEGVGYDDGSLSELQETLEDIGEENPYVRDTNIPHYEPSGEKITLSDLYDLSIFEEKVEEIRAACEAGEISDSEAKFLEASASRHIALRFDKAADYYASASATMQKLMEDQALVIVDVDDAIRNGWVKMTSRVGELLDEDMRDE